MGKKRYQLDSRAHMHMEILTYRPRGGPNYCIKDKHGAQRPSCMGSSLCVLIKLINFIYDTLSSYLMIYDTLSSYLMSEHELPPKIRPLTREKKRQYRHAEGY